ncbi:prepilin-type N-terminal cleavage/methylation domain-containing protein [bacterium]|nr:MAG: prepilin-type N-terminal cleavage/methylation domain-containing protein [bacterium]
MKKAFTLIELLVVIAIIAILAAILFPVFAQAKLAAKKISDLSNVKQLTTATLIYSNDADDVIPHMKRYDPYVFAARLLPYTKNRDIFKNPASSSPQGTTQKKQQNNGFGQYMVAPDDGCIGLGTSTAGPNKWYNDIYPPMDFMVNRFIFGYQDGCPSSDPWYAPAPNATSGSSNGMGTEGVGPSALSFTSVAKVVLFTDFPVVGTQWPGAANVPFWGSNFKGYWNEGSNVSHMDGHAQFYKLGKLLPNQADADDPHPYGAWSNRADAGTAYQWWGTNFAVPANQ